MRTAIALCFALVGSALAQAASAWPSAPAPLDALVEQAWRSNLALAGQGIEVDRASARLAEARSRRMPRLDLAARYTLADGGRTIDVPIGDLLNGAYATLNQYLSSQGLPSRFGSVANQSIPLLRSSEQETKLRVTQPLYAPAISSGVHAARSGLAAREAQQTAYRRQLRADVHEAYFRHAQAATGVTIYASARELVEESLRVNRALAAQGKVTDDVVLRAQAEAATVHQQSADAVNTRDLARSYLNFLLNRPLDTPVPELAESAATAYSELLEQIELPGLAATHREELAALTAVRSAAEANAAAVGARRRPTLALAVESGIQGEHYRTGANARYSMGSVVLDWNLFDGAERRQALAQARADERRMALEQEETRLQFDLQLQEARDEFLVARNALTTAALRRDAAREAYRLVARREAEGLANQVTVLDARATLTSAELNFSSTRARLAIAAARLDRAATLNPL
jgi:outer membrane protein